MPEVSVIIPIYNVGRFIGRCSESLMKQTLRDVEFIFVNDCTPDDSLAVLESVISRYDRDVKIISHEENKGLPSARNSGLAIAKGEFIFHCDGDDWVEENLLERMVSEARSKMADYVYCDFFLSFEKSERYMGNPDFEDPQEMLKRGFLGGTMKYNVWNKLVRRELYDDVHFPDGHSMGEDMTMIQILCGAKRVAHVKEALYHYVQTNSAAFSKTQSPKQLADVRFNVDSTVSFLESRYGSSLDVEISNFKLSIKLPFLISDSSDQYRLWQEWYPEANAYVMSNKDVALRTRLLQWMAAKNLWLGVRLYYWIVYRFAYRILFR